MEKRALINKIKYSKALYNMYYHIGSFAVKCLGLFISQKKNLIVFSSFGGRKYDDSPRCIYEEMLMDSRYKDYDLVWALGKPEDFEIEGARKVKCDTIEYYRTLMHAAVWVTNSTMERGLSFKPNSIFNVNTWHGTPIKLMGSDISKGNTSFCSKGRKNHTDIMHAQGQYDIDIFSKVFGVPRKNFRIIGLPRNDELVNCNTDENRKRIRAKLQIPESKKIILYAPTFREYDKDSGSNCILMPPIDLNKWEKELGCDYVLLMRAHYEVVKVMQFEDNGFVKNMSNYPNLNELMIVSDMLISDYSSIFFDYSVQDKPMLCFAYDYEKYSSLRGLYFDIRTKLQGNCITEEDLINKIKFLDKDKAVEVTRKFRNEYIEASGSASKQTLDIIWEYLNEKKY